MRTILLNIVSLLCFNALVPFLLLLQCCKNPDPNKHPAPQTASAKTDSISAEPQKTNFGRDGNKFFPSSNITKVVSYTFLDDYEEGNDTLDKGQLLKIMPNYDQYLNKKDPHPKVILTGSQITQLLSIINDAKSYQLATAFCYSPRNCFCFYNARNEIVGWYELCFECSRMESLPVFKASKKGGLTEAAALRLKNFCITTGITVQ